ncbi:MAG: hypothetical protein IJX92_00810 [Clostridia bacterium]|nr:hypothetical protein [Clostridia bacterium]
MNELKDIKNEWEKVQLEIRLHTKGKFRAYYFLRHILFYLRQHAELCECGDYRELYDETVTLLILHATVRSDWTREDPQNNQEWVELLCDLEGKHASEYELFTAEEVDDYLTLRKGAWERGNRYTKEGLGLDF